MKNIINGIGKLLDGLNPVTRWSIRIGSVIVFLVYLAALCMAILAGWKLNYEWAMHLCEELLYCGKECIGAVYIPAMLFEILDLATGKNLQNAEK